MAVKVKQMISRLYAFVEWEKRNILASLDCKYPAYITKEKFIAMFLPKHNLKHIASENNYRKKNIKDIREKAKQIIKILQSKNSKTLAIEAINKIDIYKSCPEKKGWMITIK